MDHLQKAFLSVGSNSGDRSLFIQQSLSALEQYSIEITAVSSLYESPSWGFESTPFLNACLCVKTELSPKELLRVLLAIESKFGRLRSKGQGYQDRTLDLDILFYENQIIETPDLTIPHPRMTNRNFVLLPMTEIAAHFIHPVLDKDMETLLRQSTDSAHLSVLDFNLWLPPIFKQFPYIVIEGNIGAGKTTLTQHVSDTYQVTPLYESFTKNPHLEAFYQNPEVAALAVETFFLEDRFETGKTFWKENIQNPVIADYSIYKSMIFAEQNLSSQNLVAYKKRFDEINKATVVPDLMIYLHQPIKHLLANIKKRGRSFEVNIEEEYLQKITSGYLHFLKQSHPFPILEIDATAFDFKTDGQAFQQLLRKINAVGT